MEGKVMGNGCCNVRFVHLRCRSDHSVGSSALLPRAIPRRAQELGMPAIGLADVGTLCGALELYKAALAVGVRPILGAQIPFMDGNVLLYARNREGWTELVLTLTHAIGHRWKAAELGGLDDNVVAVDCPSDGVAARALKRDGFDAAVAVAARLKESLPDGRCFLGVGAEVGGPSALDHDLRRVALSAGLPLALVPPVGRTEELLPAAEVVAVFPGFEDAAASTARIAELCSEPFTILGPLEQFPAPWELDPKTAAERFTRLAEDGLALRLAQLRDAGHTPDETVYRTRLDTEVALVRERRLETLFLNAANVAELCREHRILLGPGCGAMPASLLLFALGVTRIDPVAHGLPPERFLNPERVSVPGIVFQVEAERQEELLGAVTALLGRRRAMPPTRAVHDPASGLVERHVASPTKLVVRGERIFPRVPALRDDDAVGRLRADVLEEDAEAFGLWTVEIVPDEALDATLSAKEPAPVVPDDDALADRTQLGYSHGALAPFLGRTRGVLYWQEQVTEIVAEFFGVSFGRAEVLRRAIARRPGNLRTHVELVALALAAGRTQEEICNVIHALEREQVFGLPYKAKLLADALKARRVKGGGGAP